MSSVTLKIEKELLNKVKSIAKKKNPLRDINKYAEAVREALICYILENEEFLE